MENNKRHKVTVILTVFSLIVISIYQGSTNTLGQNMNEPSHSFLILTQPSRYKVLQSNWNMLRNISVTLIYRKKQERVPETEERSIVSSSGMTRTSS